MLKLYGSKTSPYVRRIRLALKDHSHELVLTDIFSPEGREALKKISPILKIPVLQDGETIIFDSQNIYDYLTAKGICHALTPEQKNELAVINGLNDSLINLFLLRRSNVTLARDTVLGRSHFERIDLSVDYLEQAAARGHYRNWNYLSICLFSLLDWATFRELLALNGKQPALLEFLTKSRTLPEAAKTDPKIA